jgi:hypothetical protein
MSTLDQIVVVITGNVQVSRIVTGTVRCHEPRRHLGDASCHGRAGGSHSRRAAQRTRDVIVSPPIMIFVDRLLTRRVAQACLWLWFTRSFAVGQSFDDLFESARQLLKQQQYAAAAAAGRKAIAADKTRWEGYYVSATAYAGANDCEAALPYFESALDHGAPEQIKAAIATASSECERVLRARGSTPNPGAVPRPVSIDPQPADSGTAVREAAKREHTPSQELDAFASLLVSAVRWPDDWVVTARQTAGCVLEVREEFFNKSQKHGHKEKDSLKLLTFSVADVDAGGIKVEKSYGTYDFSFTVPQSGASRFSTWIGGNWNTAIDGPHRFSIPIRDKAATQLPMALQAAINSCKR